MKSVGINFENREFIFETGKLAKLADGAVYAKYGESSVIATVVASKESLETVDFMPLVVEYREKAYAAGKIPGGFFKREGRPSEKEVLTSRLVDRPLRPLFPKGFDREVQIIIWVLSSDLKNATDVLSINAASAALFVSDIPFPEPLGAVRVGRIDGKLVINPTLDQLGQSDMDVVVVGTANGITMVEGGSKEVGEEELVDAISYGHERLKELIKLQYGLESVAKPKRKFIPSDESELKKEVEKRAAGRMLEAITISSKAERKEKLAQLLGFLWDELSPTEEEEKKRLKIASCFTDLEKKMVRQKIKTENKRIDGRSPSDIRDIHCEVGVLPRPHGSSLFTRGETQALVVTTLGTDSDSQIIDALEGESYKSFMLHYNFPPFSVGETKPMRSPGRREIGHGALAERSILPVLPSEEKFPYTIRIVSDILQSNGSSSMASVCGASLSLMDAGVPIKSHVAGIAMGLIKEGDWYCVLTDILGDEDHIGDMDFKVAGTEKGVTAVQMDIKIQGVSRDMMLDAVLKARDARLHILSKMKEAINEPKTELSEYAPRFTYIQIRPEKIKDLIGPGGKNIKSIIERAGVKIDVEDTGRVAIASNNPESRDKALELIKEFVQEAEIGRIYNGKVKRIVDFGAFVEICPGVEGLVHISQMDFSRIKQVRDVVKEGDIIPVKVIEVDEQGRVRLSRKEALRELQQTENTKTDNHD
ncbi:MAG TPA: polyribonucleotide nucleotidyltransferase [bacterium]